MAALVVCVSTAMACAGDDDNDNGTMSTPSSLYDRMLQVIGVQGGSDIQYSERSPLVVPPTRDLPPPVPNAAPPVPGWPKDPDVTARAKAKEKEKPHPHKDYVIESSRPLTPAELNAPGAPAPGSSGPSPGNPEAQQTSPAVTQPNKKSLFSFDLFKKEEYATFTGEPSRASLTDPPPGYLTPSPDQPYGIGPDKKNYRVPTVADRVTPTSGTAQSGQ